MSQAGFKWGSGLERSQSQGTKATLHNSLHVEMSSITLASKKASSFRSSMAAAEWPDSKIALRNMLLRNEVSSQATNPFMQVPYASSCNNESSSTCGSHEAKNNRPSRPCVQAPSHGNTREGSGETCHEDEQLWYQARTVSSPLCACTGAMESSEISQCLAVLYPNKLDCSI